MCQVNRPDTIRLQYFWLPENASLKQLNGGSGEECPAEQPASAAHGAVTEAGAAGGASRRVKMLTSMLAQLLNVARLAKVKVGSVQWLPDGRVQVLRLVVFLYDFEICGTYSLGVNAITPKPQSFFTCMNHSYCFFFF